MGYTTDFKGILKLDHKLDVETHAFLKKLANTRRMKRKLPSTFGVEGEFYVDGGGMMGQDHDESVIDYNSPPSTQPGLWCQWVPTEDGTGIEWDGGEKFYNYVEWLEYIISKVLAPKNYKLSGKISWRGEDFDDRGTITVKDNAITINEVGAPEGAVECPDCGHKFVPKA